MAIAYVSGNGANTGGSQLGSLTVTAPGSIVSGNQLVAILYAQSGGGPAWNTPSGWTLEGGVSAFGSNESMAVFSKTATGSEPASYAFTTAATAGLAGVILQYSGASGLDGSPSFAAGNGVSSGTANSVTAGSANEMWIVAVGDTSSPWTPSTPTGFTARNSSTDGLDEGAFAFEKALSSSGATGTASFTFGGSAFYISVSFLLAPGGGGASYVPPSQFRSNIATMRAATY